MQTEVGEAYMKGRSMRIVARCTGCGVDLEGAVSNTGVTYMEDEPVFLIEIEPHECGETGKDDVSLMVCDLSYKCTRPGVPTDDGTGHVIIVHPEPVLREIVGPVAASLIFHPECCPNRLKDFACDHDHGDDDDEDEYPSSVFDAD